MVGPSATNVLRNKLIIFLPSFRRDLPVFGGIHPMHYFEACLGCSTLLNTEILLVGNLYRAEICNLSVSLYLKRPTSGLYWRQLVFWICVCVYLPMVRRVIVRHPLANIYPASMRPGIEQPLQACNLTNQNMTG